ncbi:MAG: macro domain-containing protein [Clostridium sp.]
MPLFIIHGDITKLKVDAIVNAANSSLLGGGGVDGAIHRAAGNKLIDACRRLNGCEVGDAKITKGFRLPAKYVIHTVGPRWQGGHYGEKELLESCYNKSLSLALRHKCHKIAFSLISSGIYGYPTEDALKVAENTIQDWLEDHDKMTVYLVLYSMEYGFCDEERTEDIKRFILKEQLTESSTYHVTGPHTTEKPFGMLVSPAVGNPSLSKRVLNRLKKNGHFSDKKIYDNLSRKLTGAHITFYDTLCRLIDKKGLNEVECYKKANVSRKVFSRLRQNGQPSKRTVLAFVGTMGLTRDEAEKLMESAGFAFATGDKTDMIILYFIDHQITDLDEINYALADFEEPVL